MDVASPWRSPSPSHLVWVSYDSSAYLVSRFAIPAELVMNIARIDGVRAVALQD
jgi:hypothetical protein